MFNNSSAASTEGEFASGFPGELRGLEYLHKKYDSLSWVSVIQSAIKLVRNCFTIIQLLYNAINGSVGANMSSPSSFFVHNPTWAEVFAPNEKMLGMGDTLKMEKYADLLEHIASSGADVF